jgi:hypothetical protein
MGLEVNLDICGTGRQRYKDRIGSDYGIKAFIQRFRIALALGNDPDRELPFIIETAKRFYDYAYPHSVKPTQPDCGHSQSRSACRHDSDPIIEFGSIPTTLRN